ncbi:hypothetical protein GCM10009587_33690 [Microbacterium maritypicum]
MRRSAVHGESQSLVAHYCHIPNQLGPEYNVHVLESFAKHVAPALGWKPNTEGPVQGDPV